MPGREHLYSPTVTWTGNTGNGSRSYTYYSRDHVSAVAGRPEFQGSADPAFRGDPARHNPEDLLVASLSACHMLWYPHLAAEAGVAVTAYSDHPERVMVEDRERGGRFKRVTLRPRVVIESASDTERARELHSEAHARCFIANSLHFPVTCQPEIVRE
jgi:organic hydroperoxide reductase OsmC/OhrA